MILIGIDEKQVSLIKRQDKVLYLTDDDLENREVWKKVDDLLRQYPLYISIDKDVLSQNVIQTDWDQVLCNSWNLKYYSLIYLKTVKQLELIFVENVLMK